MHRVAVPLALLAGLLAWRMPARAPERADRPLASLPAPAPPSPALAAAVEGEVPPSPEPPSAPLLRSYDLRSLEGAESWLRAGFAEAIVGGAGGSLDVHATPDVHAAIEEQLAAPPDPLDDGVSDEEFRMRSSSVFSSGLFFNDGSDGEVRTRVENVFDRPLTP